MNGRTLKKHLKYIVPEMRLALLKEGFVALPPPSIFNFCRGALTGASLFFVCLLYVKMYRAPILYPIVKPLDFLFPMHRSDDILLSSTGNGRVCSKCLNHHYK